MAPEDYLRRAKAEAAQVPGLAGAVPLPVRAVGVVGAGTMGAGIALACLNAGLAVTVVEATDEALARGRQRIEDGMARALRRGRLDVAARHERLARLTVATALEEFATADLVIEAVFEDLGVKSELFARLGRLARADAVLATNTSYLDVAALAAASGRAERVLGLHFFAPAAIMWLVEVVPKARGGPLFEVGLARPAGAGKGHRRGPLP